MADLGEMKAATKAAFMSKAASPGGHPITDWRKAEFAGSNCQATAKGLAQLMRKGEAIYKELNLKSERDQNALIEAMAAHPKLIERPIVVKGNHAILGRPPENVAKFL